jgi:hypothetical protein
LGDPLVERVGDVEEDALVELALFSLGDLLEGRVVVRDRLVVLAVGQRRPALARLAGGSPSVTLTTSSAFAVCTLPADPRT